MYITIITKWKLALERWKTCDGSWRAKRARKSWLTRDGWGIKFSLMFKINKNEGCQLP